MSTDSTPPEEEVPDSTPEATAEGTAVPVEPAVVDEPVVDEPVVEEPVAVEEPAVEEPETAAPATDGSDLPDVTLGQGAPAEEDAIDPNYVPVLRGKIDRFGVAMGTGRRKTSVARVRIKEGTGKFVVNGRVLEEFFCVERDREQIQGPLKLVDKLGEVDISVRVNGGGTTGQSGAVILGISRALQASDPSLHHKLADAGYLTRDSRMVERKKYGLRKARRAYQFSKR